MTPSPPPKIAVVGCGALGSYYGAHLCRAGSEVHFLLRSDYAAVHQNGVQIRSAAGNFSASPHCARTPEAIGPCDLILIGLKTTANHLFPQLLPPLVGPHSRVLTLQNGLGNEEQLAQVVGPGRVLGGLCFVCINRVAPGVIQHVAHGKIALGEFQGPAQPRTETLAALFRAAGIPCEVTDDLRQAHWEKLVWNIPFNGLGVASTAGYDAVLSGRVTVAPAPGLCLTTDRLLGEPRWEKLVRELMAEVIQSARALGMTIPDEAAGLQIARTRSMGAYRASTLIDYERGQPLELESLFQEPLRQAQHAGITAPRLTALCQVLAHLNPAAPTETTNQQLPLPH